MSTWTSSFPPDRYGTYTVRGTDGNTYTWNNDCWSEGAGPQAISVKDNNDWSVVSSQTWNELYWVQTYPHIGWAGGKPLSQYPAVTGTATGQGPGYAPELQWEAAYDIWLNNGNPGADSGYEVMIWTDTSNVSPSGYVKDVTIAGVDYAFYQAQGGNGPASWLVRKVNAPSSVTDIKAVLEFVAAHGGNYSGPPDPTVDTIEYGWEVWGTGSKPVHFVMTQFSLAFSGSTPPPPPPPPPPVITAAPLLVKANKVTTYSITVNRAIKGYTGTYATKITGPAGFVLHHNSREAVFTVEVFNPGTYTLTTGGAGYANSYQTVRVG